jgi:hypothetical protein
VLRFFAGQIALDHASLLVKFFAPYYSHSVATGRLLIT